MKKDIFIRIDIKGTWRGSEHRSGGAWDFDNENPHDGASCYRIGNGEGVEKLRRYWTEYAMLNRLEDYTDKHVTIFEGIETGTGPDWEEIAVCKKTLAEVDAVEFMKKVFEAEERAFEEEIDEDEYHAELLKIVHEYAKIPA